MSDVLAGLLVAAALLPPLVEGPPEAPLLGPGWRLALLPRQTKPVTRFLAERVDEHLAVRIDAQASYGNLLHEMPAGGPQPQRLKWSWRVQQPNPGTHLDRRSGDDMAARVCLSFEVALDVLHFEDRVMLQIARSVAGQPLPAATLCWVWGHAEPHGTELPSPYTSRVRYIVLRNAGDAPGHWFDESRDIAADFHRAFGSEIPGLPPVIAVLIGGDADNTGAHSVAHIAGLHFDP
jgi:hypothetical protein